MTKTVAYQHDLAKRLHERRNELHLSLEEVAERVGVSWQSVQAWEYGEIARSDKWEAIASALSTTVPELFLGSSPTAATINQINGNATAGTEDQQRMLRLGAAFGNCVAADRDLILELAERLARCD